MAKSTTKTVKSDSTTKAPARDKGDAPNLATYDAGLELNVSETKKWLREYFGYEPKKKNDKKDKDDEEEDDDKPEQVETGQEKKTRLKLPSNDNSACFKIMGSHNILTACDQVLCLELINAAVERTSKGTGGLYTFTTQMLQDTVSLNKDFNYVFSKHLDKYTESYSYGTQVRISQSSVSKLLDKHALSGGVTQLHVDKQAFNFMMFLVLTSRIEISKIARNMALYAGKTTIDERVIMFAIHSIYTGDLLRTIRMKYEDVHSRTKSIKDKDKDKDDDKDDNKEKSEEKKSKKKSKDDGSDDESDDDSDKESENDSDDESDDDSKKKKKSKPKHSKSKKSKSSKKKKDDSDDESDEDSDDN